MWHGGVFERPGCQPLRTRLQCFITVGPSALISKGAILKSNEKSDSFTCVDFWTFWTILTFVYFLVLRRTIALEYDIQLTKCQSGFDPSLEHLVCLVILKSCDTTKLSVCGWRCIYTPPRVENFWLLPICKCKVLLVNWALWSPIA